MDINQIKQFKDSLIIGEDINLIIDNKMFWLGAWKDNKRIISECPNGKTEGIYDTADDLINSFMINNKPLVSYLNTAKWVAV